MFAEEPADSSALQPVAAGLRPAQAIKPACSLCAALRLGALCDPAGGTVIGVSFDLVYSTLIQAPR